uniref:Biogenesis of lysosomal organelles complex 1 subunit 4 n=1 Tax=Pavo cristatus TaxID=9049 RepID=A0A8C9EN10_PAVCR
GEGTRPGGGMAAAGVGAEAAGGCSGGDSGNVSQSHSNASGLGGQEDEEGDALDARGRSAPALCSALCGSLGARVESLEKSLEELLTRVDEFVGMLDMVRGRHRSLSNLLLLIFAFVKMVANHVAGMEERVVKAETDLGAFPSTFKKILHTISIPSFRNKSSSSRQQTAYEPPVLFKTEDYFPCPNEAPY